MMAYVGQTRSAKLIEKLSQHGIGEATQPNEFPPRRSPWFLDNGAFRDWKAGRSFDEASFMRAVERSMDATAPDFVVLPDIVASKKSLEFSLSYVDRLRSACSRLAFVVQDGMTEDEISSIAEVFEVLFVGGSLEWKLATAKNWVDFAHRIGKRCHIGRVGTRKRMLWARAIEADSVDSCTPLFSARNMDNWISSITEPLQMAMFGHSTPPPKSISIVRKKASSHGKHYTDGD